jgi:excisionase family DNA binding protein
MDLTPKKLHNVINENSIAEFLQRIDERQAKLESLMLSQKNVLTFEEGATFTGLSKSYLYKMTSTGLIPCYRPNGKLIYFERQQLEQWLLRGKATSADEIETQASNYVTIGKGGAK